MSISYDKKRNYVTMNCNNYRQFSKYDICFSHYMNYDKLQKIIFNKISVLSMQYMEDKEEFERIIKEDYVDSRQELNKKIEALNKSIENLKLKQDSLYDDKFNNAISSDTYQK